MASFGVEPAQSGRPLTPACHWAPLRRRTTMPSSPGVAVTWAAAASNRAACAQSQGGGHGGGAETGRRWAGRRAAGVRASTRPT